VLSHAAAAVAHVQAEAVQPTAATEADAEAAEMPIKLTQGLGAEVDALEADTVGVVGTGTSSAEQDTAVPTDLTTAALTTDTIRAQNQNSTSNDIGIA
jgi:hypothetical protein